MQRNILVSFPFLIGRECSYEYVPSERRDYVGVSS